MRIFLLVGVVAIMAKGQFIGALETLPGLGVSMTRVYNRMVVSNGHDRPRVTDGKIWSPIGIRAPVAAPTISGYSGGSVTGRWRFYSQYYDSWRGVASNLSPCSDWTDNVKNAAITIHHRAFSEWFFISATKTWVGTTRDPCDVVRIWAEYGGDEDHAGGVIKRVGQFALSQDELTWTFNTPQEEYDGIIADGEVFDNLVGNPYRGLSIGNDVFPACAHMAFWKARLWGIGMENYSYPGASITITKYADLSSGAWSEKDWLNGLHESHGKPTRVGTGVEIRRAKVTLNPVAESTRYSKLWSYGLKTFVAVANDNSTVWFVIDGRRVAKIKKDGSIYIRGTYTEQGAMSPPSRTSQFQWDATRRAILLNIDVGPYGGPSSWEGCIIIDYRGNLTFDRLTTVTTWSGGSYDYAAARGPVTSLAGNTVSWIMFLAYADSAVPVGQISYSNAAYRWDKTESSGRLSSIYAITQNASDMLDEDTGLEQIGEYPRFSQGLLYKALVLDWGQGNKQIAGWVWDVSSDGKTLYLSDDYYGNDIENAENWEFVGLQHLFYSGYGNPEGCYAMQGLLQEGLGSFFWGEFDPEPGLKSVGLWPSPWGLEVLFREKSFLINTNDAGTPIIEASVDQQESRETTWAKRSMANDRQRARLSLVTNPKGIARIAGGRSQVLTDAAGNRVAFSTDLDQRTAAGACATFWSDHRGDRYLIGNLDPIIPDGTTGERGYLLDVRDPSKVHVTRLAGMDLMSLLTIQDDNGEDVVVYGDRSGNLGMLFRAILDENNDQGYEYRLYVSPVDLQPITITGARLFVQTSYDPTYDSTGTVVTGWDTTDYWITCGIYAVNPHMDRETIRGSLAGLPYQIVFFSKNDLLVGKWMPIVKPITSGAFVIVMNGSGGGGPDPEQPRIIYGRERYVKGIEIEYTISGEVETTR